jgi:hypothetical protein
MVNDIPTDRASGTIRQLSFGCGRWTVQQRPQLKRDPVRYDGFAFLAPMTVKLAIGARDVREILAQIDVSYAGLRERGSIPRVPFVADIVPAVSAWPWIPETMSS